MSEVEDRDLGMKRILAELKKLDGAQVLVGIQSEADSQLKKIAVIHEYGSREWTVTRKQAYFMARRLMNIDPEAEPERFWGTVHALTGKKMKIAERSYLRSTFDENRPRLQAAMGKVVDAVTSGQLGAQAALDQFGLQVTRLVQKKITGGIAPGNAALTIALKRGQNTPLINSGRFVNSIRHKTKLKGGP
jgi:hypothetical protein